MQYCRKMLPSRFTHFSAHFLRQKNRFHKLFSRFLDVWVMTMMMICLLGNVHPGYGTTGFLHWVPLERGLSHHHQNNCHPHRHHHHHTHHNHHNHNHDQDHDHDNVGWGQCWKRCTVSRRKWSRRESRRSRRRKEIAKLRRLWCWWFCLGCT